MSSVNSECLTSLPIQMSFISSCCLITEATRTSSTVLNNGESGHSCHVPDFRGKALFFPVVDEISCGFFVCGFYEIEVCSFSHYFFEGFYQERMLYFVKCFFCIY